MALALGAPVVPVPPEVVGTESEVVAVPALAPPAPTPLPVALALEAVLVEFGLAPAVLLPVAPPKLPVVLLVPVDGGV